MNSMCEFWEGASYESQRSHTPVLEKTDGNFIVCDAMILEIQRFGNSMNTTLFHLHKDADSSPKKCYRNQVQLESFQQLSDLPFSKPCLTCVFNL